MRVGRVTQGLGPRMPTQRSFAVTPRLPKWRHPSTRRHGDRRAAARREVTDAAEPRVPRLGHALGGPTTRRCRSCRSGWSRSAAGPRCRGVGSRRGCRRAPPPAPRRAGSSGCRLTRRASPMPVAVQHVPIEQPPRAATRRSPRSIRTGVGAGRGVESMGTPSPQHQIAPSRRDRARGEDRGRDVHQCRRGQVPAGRRRQGRNPGRTHRRRPTPSRW